MPDSVCVCGLREGAVNRSGAVSKWGLPGKHSRRSAGLGSGLSLAFTPVAWRESNSKLLPLLTACLAGCLGIPQALISLMPTGEPTLVSGTELRPLLLSDMNRKSALPVQLLSLRGGLVAIELHACFFCQSGAGWAEFL